MESRLSTLATCGFGIQTSLEAHNRLSCPCLADETLPFVVARVGTVCLLALVWGCPGVAASIFTLTLIQAQAFTQGAHSREG